MRFRKLRIAWSVFWGLVAVLLVVLWVRSYWWCDGITCSRNCPIGGAYSVEGRIRFNRIESLSTEKMSWDVSAMQITSAFSEFEDIPMFSWVDTGPYRELSAPHWFLAAAFGVLGIVPMLLQSKWRFSLRTLLIATALVALALGLMTYVASR
jgi:hypothetical protein